MEVIGWVYTVCFAICYVPQIVKSIKTKKVQDISISLFVLSLIGYLCASIYTIYTIGFNAVLLTNYTLGSICSLIMIIVYFMYRCRLNTDIMATDDFQNSSYYQFLKQEQQEIDKLKWIESEKAGRDIGRYKAVFLWNKNHRREWLVNRAK